MFYVNVYVHSLVDKLKYSIIYKKQGVSEINGANFESC